jgi:hypothetical protein
MRTTAEMSLREVADALEITHVYLGEVERGRRRILPKKYWKKLAQLRPGVTFVELKQQAAASEPIDPALMDGPSREFVVALARRLEENDLSDALAKQLLALLSEQSRRK